MHSPVNPVEEEVGKDKPQNYLRCTWKPLYMGHGEYSAQLDGVESFCQQRFPHLSRGGSHGQRKEVQRQVAAPFDSVTGTAALQSVEDQNNYDKCYSLIDLLFFNHVYKV